MDALTHDVQVIIALAFTAAFIFGIAVIAGAVLSRVVDDASDN